MSLPAFTEYVNPLLAALRKLGGAARPQQVFQTIARDLAAPSDLLEERLSSGASRFENQIAWARWYLVATGFIDGSHRGVWKLTDKAWTAGILSEESLRQIVAETQSKGKVSSAEDDVEVPETSGEELDIEKLKALYNSDTVSQWFLEHAASRQRNQSETSVERALQILKSDGYEVSRQQIISVFKGLADCNCGQFVKGRRPWPSRFVWATAMVSVGRAATGEQEDVEQFSEETTEPQSEHHWLTHSFHLRPEVTLEIDLPADLTPREAQRIARFMEALPFDGDS